MDVQSRGADVDNCDPALAALLALAIERARAHEAAKVHAERAALQRGVQPCSIAPNLALPTCDDGLALAEALIDAGADAPWCANGALVCISGPDDAGRRPMADLIFDDGEVWPRTGHEDGAAAAVAAPRDLGVARLEWLVLAATDDDGALLAGG